MYWDRYGCIGTGAPSRLRRWLHFQRVLDVLDFVHMGLRRTIAKLLPCPMNLSPHTTRLEHPSPHHPCAVHALTHLPDGVQLCEVINQPAMALPVGHHVLQPSQLVQVLYALRNGYESHPEVAVARNVRQVRLCENLCQQANTRSMTA